MEKTAIFGDSIAYGARTSPAVVTTAQRFSKLLCDARGYEEDNQAVGGEQSTQIKNRVVTYLASNTPKALIVMPGHNDADVGSGTAVSLATFKTNLHTIIQTAIDAGVAEIIICTPPTTAHSNIKANLPDYIDAIYSVAERYNVHVVDIHAAFSAIYQRDTTTHDTYFMDSEHPSVAGHAAIKAVFDMPRYSHVLVAVATEEEDPEDPEPGDPETVFDHAFQEAFGSMYGKTVRIVLKAGSLNAPSGTPTQIRFHFRGSSENNVPIDDCHFQNGASSGDVSDFSTSAIPLTFGGSNDTILAANTLVASDWINFTYDHTKNIVVSGYFPHATLDAMQGKGYTAPANPSELYTKSGNDTTTVNASGYSGTYANWHCLVEKVEVK